MGWLADLIRSILGPKRDPPAPRPPVPPPEPPPPRPAPPSQISPWDLLDAINAARSNAGLRRLPAHVSLNGAAAGHAADMARRDYFGHISPEGRTHSQRARDAGYPGAALEVLAWNYPTANSTVAGWLASPGHKAAILHPHATHAGAGTSGPFAVALIGSVEGVRSLAADGVTASPRPGVVTTAMPDGTTRRIG